MKNVKNVKIKKTLVGIAAIATALVLSACQKESANQSQTSVGTSDSSAKVEKILVGTMGTYAPFTYEDEAGKLTGFDVELLRLVDAKIPDVELEFVPTPWDSMFLGLDAGKYQIVANQIVKNPDREKKYLFTADPYFSSFSQIVVKKGNAGNVQTLDDLKGKTVGSAVGDSYTIFLEQYNKDHGNPFTIKYYDGEITPVLQDVASGKTDAYLNDRIVVSDSIKKLGLNVEMVGEPLNRADKYFVFRQDEQGKALKAKVDKALAELRASGELSALSTKWFGEDFTQFK